MEGGKGGMEGRGKRKGGGVGGRGQGGKRTNIQEVGSDLGEGGKVTEQPSQPLLLGGSSGMEGHGGTEERGWGGRGRAE